jgi:hypothetical protein
MKKSRFAGHRRGAADYFEDLKFALGRPLECRYQRFMRRILPLLILTLTGCNAPMAAFLDTCFPSRAKNNAEPSPPPGPGVDVAPRPPADPVRPALPEPAPGGGGGPLPPPDFGK